MRILFIGTGDIGVPALQALLQSEVHQVLGVVTQPDKPAGRKQELLASPVKQLALRHQTPVFQPQRIREKSAIEQIQSLRSEVIVVMAYGQILPREILLVPSLAILNLHASLLPRHRGAAPIQAAIESGDRESGITVMYVDEGLDTGDILLKKGIPIRRRETGGSLHDRLAQLAPEALFEALTLLKQGRAPRLPQDSALATYAAKLSRENGAIDWSENCAQIDRKIRAMNPWPAAYTLLSAPDGSSRKLKIFTTIQSRKCSGAPGEVLRTDKHGILVAAGKGGLLLREVQLEGKKRMSARDFLLGNPLPPGTILCSQ
jgi:methionyl-tRNA formyltransferase